MYGENYMWLLLGWWSKDWWLVDDTNGGENLTCTPEELIETVASSMYIATEVEELDKSSRETVARYVSKSCTQRCIGEKPFWLKSKPTPSIHTVSDQNENSLGKDCAHSSGKQIASEFLFSSIEQSKNYDIDRKTSALLHSVIICRLLTLNGQTFHIPVSSSMR